MTINISYQYIKHVISLALAAVAQMGREVRRSSADLTQHACAGMAPAFRGPILISYLQIKSN